MKLRIQNYFNKFLACLIAFESISIKPKLCLKSITFLQILTFSILSWRRWLKGKKVYPIKFIYFQPRSLASLAKLANDIKPPLLSTTKKALHSFASTAQQESSNIHKFNSIISQLLQNLQPKRSKILKKKKLTDKPEKNIIGIFHPQQVHAIQINYIDQIDLDTDHSCQWKNFFFTRKKRTLINLSIHLKVMKNSHKKRGRILFSDSRSLPDHNATLTLQTDGSQQTFWPDCGASIRNLFLAKIHCEVF